MKFDGKTAVIISASETLLLVGVPAKATTGKITVEANGQIATTANNFTLLKVTIDSFTPAVARVGALVVIDGAGFNASASANVVRFNGTPAAIIMGNESQLYVIVPVSPHSGDFGLIISAIL